MYNGSHFIDKNVLLHKRNKQRFDRNTCCVNTTIGTQGKTPEKKKSIHMGIIGNKLAFLHLKD